MTQQLKIELVTAKKTESLEDIREFAYSMTMAAGFPERERRLIVNAIETAATGIILNAREQGIEGGLTVMITADETRLRVELNDPGDITPRVTGSRAARHGLGIFHIRRIMHEVEYEYKRGFISRLTMVRFR